MSTKQPEAQRMIQLMEWIEEVLGEKIDNKNDMHAALKDGKLLIKLANKIQPSLKLQPQKMNMPFNHRENIVAFLKGIRQIGVPDADSFETNDLYEARNLGQVCLGLESLGRISQTVKGYAGPAFGPKLATKNVRDHNQPTNPAAASTYFEQAYMEIQKEKKKDEENYRKGRPDWHYK